MFFFYYYYFYLEGGFFSGGGGRRRSIWLEKLHFFQGDSSTLDNLKLNQFDVMRVFRVLMNNRP